nr:MaoC family dehydratase [Halorubrum sp. Atlit-26R]
MIRLDETDTGRWTDAAQRWIRPWARAARAFPVPTPGLDDAAPQPSDASGSEPDGDRSADAAADAPEELRIGQVVSYGKRLTDADVRAFARASGDENPLHLVEAYARETRFGERVAHGILVAGVISAALAKLPGLVVYLSQDLRFLGPVSVGDRVTAECEVLEPVGDDRYRLHTRVTTDDGETVVDGEAVVLIGEAPPEATGANTYQSRRRTGGPPNAAQIIRTAVEHAMLSNRPTRHGDPTETAAQNRRRAVDLGQRAVEQQFDLPRRFARAAREATPEARSAQRRADAVARDLTRLALRTPMTAWSSSARAAETEADVDEFVERSFEPLADLRAANWSLVEEGLDAQIAAYESFVDAMTGGGMRPTATPDRGFDADETPGPDR